MVYQLLLILLSLYLSCVVLLILTTDMVAVPNYIGGMENWGLIVFAEKLLLYEHSISSEKDKQFAAMVIGHEISHQVR